MSMRSYVGYVQHSASIVLVLLDVQHVGRDIILNRDNAYHHAHSISMLHHQPIPATTVQLIA